MYEHLAKAVIARLEADDDERAKADWWIRRLRRSDARKLVKRPMMTYGYNVSLTGMKRQLDEVESNGDTFYLAQRIMETTKAELPGPTAVMEFIEDLAEEAYNQGKPLACTMPSGFAWSNIYRKSNTKVVYLPYRDEHARYSKYRRYHVGDGFTPEMRKLKTLNAAAPNFVHGCDAALLISAANALAGAASPISRRFMTALHSGRRRWQRAVTSFSTSLQSSTSTMTHLQSYETPSNLLDRCPPKDH